MLKRLALLAIGATLTCAPMVALAQTNTTLQNRVTGQLNQTGTAVFGNSAGAQGDLLGIINSFINILLSFVGVVLFGFFLYAGFLWMTAGGNEEQTKSARKILQNATVGLIIVVTSYAISIFVFSVLDSALQSTSAEEGAINQQLGQ